MSRHRIGADPQDIARPLVELRDPTADRGQFGRSDEREIAGVKEKHQPTVDVIIERDASALGSGTVGAEDRKVRGSSTNHYCSRHLKAPGLQG